MHSSRLTLLVLIAGLSLAVTGVRAQDAARGATLLGQAQQALGGTSRLANVKTLQVTGTFRRVVGDNDTEGDFEVFIELPDKYLRSEKTGTPGQPSTETIEGLVGAEARDLVRGGGRGVGGGGAIGGDGGAPPADAPAAAEPGGDGPAAGGNAPGAPAAAAGGRGRGRGGVDPMSQLRARQADVSRLLLMWLLRSDVAPLVWVGTAEAPDGKADVLEARYADGQPTRLFLEAASHMPLMLQWQSMPVARGGGAGGRRGGGGRGQAPPGGAGAPDAAGAGRQAGPPQPVTLDMTFSDHRDVNGIRLPHLITRGTNGQTTERWTVTRYRVNPSIAAETFTR